MRRLGGVDLFTEIDEIVRPGHTALLVVDAQRDFCSPDGVAAKLGRDLSIIQSAIPKVRAVVDAARAAGVFVIYIQNVWLPANKSCSGSWLRFSMQASCVNPEEGWTTIGSKGAEIIAEVGRLPTDVVIQKYRSSAFFGTQLNTVLRCNGIKSVVCVGFVTEGCLESTARDAMFHDYYTVVLEDCVGTFQRELHEAALTVLRVRVDVTSSGQVLTAWHTKVAATERVASADAT
jgi:nicotinamidase-related amidase